MWATSWGVSTRLIGALIMAHSDDQGLIMPPKIAPVQVVIIPIYKGDTGKTMMDEKIAEIIRLLKEKGISVKYDNSDHSRPGWKFAEYELKGVPVRIAIGMRDIENNVAEVARRDTKEKKSYSLDGLAESISILLDDIQQNLYKKAASFKNENTRFADSWDEFNTMLDAGGFISAHWDGTGETEDKIKELTKAT
ncbi:MAG: His/Gly/Thr/Pro-type tRNA ligase C-terminal domain-containing protein, partial [Ferruginibacter sp.]